MPKLAFGLAVAREDEMSICWKAFHRLHDDVVSFLGMKARDAADDERVPGDPQRSAGAVATLEREGDLIGTHDVRHHLYHCRCDSGLAYRLPRSFRDRHHERDVLCRPHIRAPRDAPA